MPHLQLTLLGGFTAALDGQPLDFRTQKIKALLVYLALGANTSFSRDHLMGLLWSDSPQPDARNNLRVSLTRLRKTLGTDAFLLLQGDTIQFDPQSAFTLDVTQFRQIVERQSPIPLLAPLENETPLVSRDGHSLLGDLQSAYALYRGDLLTGFFVAQNSAFEEWLVIERERLHQQFLEISNALAQHHTQRGDPIAANIYLRRSLEMEPWREETHRALMQNLARAGERSAALRQYETCCRVLEHELRVAPEPETVALYKQILRGDVEPLVLAAITVRLHNLPSLLTPFFGRHSELKKIQTAFDTPTTRLVTLLGEGGVGKTRLALAVAEHMLPRFPDGVWFVPLADVQARSDAVSVALTNATLKAFGLPPSVLVDLYKYLRTRELLLLLDNFEELVQGAAWIAELLLGAPRVRVLVTSRVPLNLQAEYRLRIQGLPVPENLDDAAVRDSGSIQLFSERAERVSVTLKASDMSAVAQICRMVDGSPLAIELAAAWMDRETPALLAQTIQRDLDVLATTRLDVPMRHRSMRLVLDHSWAMLSPAQRQVLASVSVFRGGFGAEATAFVAQEFNAQKILTGLCELSLLHTAEHERYTMHELVQHYSAEKLAQSETGRARTQARHGEYFGIFLEAREGALKSGGQLRAMQELRRETENLFVAWQWMLWRGDSRAVAKALEAYYVFYDLDENWDAGEQHFELAVRQLEQYPQTRPLRIRLLNRQAHFSARLARFDHALELLAASAALNQEMAQPIDSATHWYVKGTVEIFPNKIASARSLLLSALEAFNAQGDEWGAVRTLLKLTLAETRLDDQIAARDWLEQALERGRVCGAPWEQAQALHMRGAVETALENYPDAAAAYDECISLRRMLGNPLGLAMTLNNLGDVFYRMGMYEHAEMQLKRSLELVRQFNDAERTANTLSGLGMVAVARGDYAGAEREWLEMRQLLPDLHDQFLRDGMILLEAQLARLRGDTAHARTLITPYLANTQVASWLRVEARALYQQLEHPLGHLLDIHSDHR